MEGVTQEQQHIIISSTSGGSSCRPRAQSHESEMNLQCRIDAVPWDPAVNGGSSVIPYDELGLDNVKISRGHRHTSQHDGMASAQEYGHTSSFQTGTYSLNSTNTMRSFYTEEEEDEPLLNLGEDEEEDSHCHSAATEYSNRGARNQLIIASTICLVFMVGEFVGGYMANSLAIMTDAGHLLSDFGSFMISIFALWLANLKPTTKMSFGFYRAEVLGAVLSILIIWVLTAVLVYLAVLRFIHRDFDINADVMLITAGCGVFLNVVLALVLCTTGHGHSHGISHGHSHGNEHSGDGDGHTHGGHRNTEHSQSKNINVRAAFIHVIGDFIQSVGVFIAALIIKFAKDTDKYKLADPICTFIFSILVLITTITILKDAVYLLMEGVPKSISLQSVHDDLQNIEHIETVHSLNIWSLTVNRVALAVHLTVAKDNLTTDTHQTILSTASSVVRKKYNIDQITIQVEEYQDAVMANCKQCRGPCS